MGCGDAEPDHTTTESEDTASATEGDQGSVDSNTTTSTGDANASSNAGDDATEPGESLGAMSTEASDTAATNGDVEASGDDADATANEIDSGETDSSATTAAGGASSEQGSDQQGQADGGAPADQQDAMGGGSDNGDDGAGGANAGPGGSAGAGEDGDEVPSSLLVFSRTTGFRHDSIGDGIAMLTELAESEGWALTASEDPGLFTDQGLSSFGVVVFLSTTGDVLDDDQQAAFERFIQSGRGYVGIHAASDTEYDWPWYGDLVGAYFSAHPAIQQASLVVEDANHAATEHLSNPWQRTDEWYGFVDNPRDSVSVLLTIDESSYDAGDGAMGNDHPIAWYHEYDGGRVFYTALGHTSESYAEADFIQHVAGGIEWVLGP